MFLSNCSTISFRKTRTSTLSKDSLFRRNCKLSTTLEENQQLKTRKVRLLITPQEIIIIVKHHVSLKRFQL